MDVLEGDWLVALRVGVVCEVGAVIIANVIVARVGCVIAIDVVLICAVFGVNAGVTRVTFPDILNSV